MGHTTKLFCWFNIKPVIPVMLKLNDQIGLKPGAGSEIAICHIPANCVWILTQFGI